MVVDNPNFRVKSEKSEPGLNDHGFVVTIPSISDFAARRASDTSIRSVSLTIDPTDENQNGKKRSKKKPKEGTMASITQGINMMPDSEYVHKYWFDCACWKSFRSIFLVSDRPRIHRLGYRSPVSVFVERSRHLASFPTIIHPYSNFRWVLDIVMSIFLLITLIVDPVRLTFFAQDLIGGGGAHIEISATVTTIFIIDILINFRTGKVDSSSDLVTLDPYQIAKSYLKSWFIIDVLSTIPFDLVYIAIERSREGPMSAHAMRYSKAVRILELLKFLRLTRVIRYVSRLLFAYKVTRMYIHFVEAILASIFMTHWHACFHYLIADIFNEGLAEKKPQSWVTVRNLWDASVGEKYLNAFYRVLSTAVAVGTDAAYSREPEDIFCSCVSMLSGVILVACYIGLIASILQSQGVAERKYMDIVNQVQEYLRFKQVPVLLQRRILLFYETRYQRNFFREQDILNSVSDVLRKELLMHNCRHLVEAVPIFRDLPQAVIYALISKLQFEVYLPLDVVVTVNTVGETMYFIEHGMVSIVAENGRVLGHLKDGDFFGELALISHEKRVASVVATSSCNTYKLTQADFNHAMRDYPELLDRIMKIARGRKSDIRPANLRDLKAAARKGQGALTDVETDSTSDSSESSGQSPPPPPPANRSRPKNK